MNYAVRVCLCGALLNLGGCLEPGSVQDSYELAAQGVYTGALSAGSDLALIGSLNHGASLWSTRDHARLFDWQHRAGEFADLVAGAFSPDGTRAVTADPRTLVVWDTRSGEATASWTTPGSTLSVALADDGRVLMGLTDHSAVLFDAQSGAHLETFLHEGTVGSVALSADGRWALTGSDDESAVLWDTDSGSAVHRLPQDNPVRVVALSEAGRYAFTAAQGRAVTVWRGADGEPSLVLSERNPGVTSARFSRDERFLLVGYVNRLVELWDLTTGRRVQRWHTAPGNPWNATGGAVLALGFGPANRYYALAGDGRLLQLQRS